jgi:hypothetical protein
MKNNNLVKGFLCLGIVSLSIGCTNLDEQILDGVANDNSAGASLTLLVQSATRVEILMVKEVFMQWMKCLLTQWLVQLVVETGTMQVYGGNYTHTWALIILKLEMRGIHYYLTRTNVI